MNVIIAGKNKDVFSNLPIDVSKRLDGEFEVDDIINSFSNFFYNKMFLDITAIKNYKDLRNIQKLSMALDMNKLILFLDKNDSEINNNSYLSRLVSFGIYNFTNDEVGLMYLYNNPNSYRDVASYHTLVDNNVTDNSVINNSTVVVEKKQRIIAFKNVTSNAGATSLIYMIKKILEEYYNVCAIEVTKRDFIFLRDNNLFSVEEKDLGNTILKCHDYDVILLDLNNVSSENIGADVIYLIEPSTIKLNRMIMLDKEIFNKLNGRRIVLNKSLLNEGDIKEFERESNSTVFYNLPPMDDKKNNSNMLVPFLSKLNLLSIDSGGNSSNDDNKLFGLFKI